MKVKLRAANKTGPCASRGARCSAMPGGNKRSSYGAKLLGLLTQRDERKELTTCFNLSPETIKTHVRNIHQKLRVSTTQQAVRKVYPAKRFRLLPRWMRGGEPT